MLTRIYTAILLSTLFISSSQACTVWGVITPEKVLIAKNRDFYPGNQKFIAVANKGKYKFFGLYGDNQYDNNYTIKMGINETGLTVFMTFASSIPLKQRAARIPYYKVMENILGNYNNVDAVQKDSKRLFQDSTPINYVFVDRSSAMICEIGLKNDYKCEVYARDANKKAITFAQTNHYILQGMEQYNLVPVADQQTSYYRLNKINALMKNNFSNLTLDQFIKFSFNTQAANDNPLAKFDAGYENTYQDNGIFRTFNSHPDRKNKTHPNSDQGVSTMMVEISNNKYMPIRLYLRKVDSITDSQDKPFTQQIKYTDVTTTLDRAIYKPDSINYVKKTCKRDVNSVSCR